VSTQPNQGKGKNPDQDRYGGYAGYQPRKPADDPYGAYYRPGGNQQEERHRVSSNDRTMYTNHQVVSLGGAMAHRVRNRQG